MRAREVAEWVSAHPLSPAEVDCATAVMLKILDGKCKMNAAEKPVMRQLYHAVKGFPGERLGADMHALIASAEGTPDENLREEIYAHRVLAETMISRPVMKAFKAMLRREGLLEQRAAARDRPREHAHATA